MKNYYVYIVSNWNNRVIYTGVTNHPARRIFEHKNQLCEGFTKKYKVDKLVYIEETQDVSAAIAREKQIKSWRREKKNKLIETINPDWVELESF